MKVGAAWYWINISFNKLYKILSIIDLCEFHEGNSIFDSDGITITAVQLHDAKTKEECALIVHNEKPNATGVIWIPNNHCTAAFGNDMHYDIMDWRDGRWACLFPGISRYVHLNPTLYCLILEFNDVFLN